MQSTSPSPPPAHWPDACVSVVIPCHNEARHIGDVLSALSHQDYPKDRFEIIVVDNNSTDATVQTAESFRVKVLQEPFPSSYAARNLGVRHALYEWIAFLDGDCIPDEGWIRNMVATAAVRQSRYVAGRIDYVSDMDTLANRLLASRRAPEVCRDRAEKQHCVPGGNMLIHRSVFGLLGEFPAVKSGGDIAFSRGAAATGVNISYAFDAVVFHQSDFTNLGLLHRTWRVRYGQELLSNEPAGYRRLARTILAVPWRPGIRAAGPVARISGCRKPSQLLALWLFLWCERWFGYFGAVGGAWRAFRR